jgi:hypothetical protein
MAPTGIVTLAVLDLAIGYRRGVPSHDLAPGPDPQPRCAWGVSTSDYVAYHDRESGFPVTEDRRLFEKLYLEGLSGRVVVADDPAHEIDFLDGVADGTPPLDTAAERRASHDPRARGAGAMLTPARAGRLPCWRTGALGKP